MFRVAIRRLSVGAMVVLTMSACSSNKQTATPGSAASTSTPSSSAFSTTAPHPTASEAPPVDPLPGAVLIGYHGRTIDALDARGAVIKTLVTAFAGRIVVNAAIMADHRTIWYATNEGAPPYCNEVVRLDLQTNTRTVEAFAHDFTLSADQTRLLLVWPESASAGRTKCGESAAITTETHEALLLRDLDSGAQSTVAFSAYPTAGTGSPSGHIWMSATGDRLVDATCTEDPCITRSFTVPAQLGAPLVVGAFGSGPKCGCSTLSTGRDGVYAVDIGSHSHPQTRLLRYQATDLTGSGTVLVVPADLRLRWVAPTAHATYVSASPVGAASPGVYRLDGTMLTRVGTAVESQIFAVPPFVVHP